MRPGAEALLLENERLQRELLQTRAALEDFTSSVSHDLRASLRHVSAYVQIVREELGEQTQAALLAHMDTVSHAARQMGRQIDGLMELSRLARVELQPVVVETGPLVRDVCAELAPSFAGRVLEWRVAPDLPALQGDAALIRQVLMHLLSNAIKFTGPRALAEIEIRWQAHASGLCALTVKDNGVGFNPQYASKLFHAFARLHSAREFEGLGMGLVQSRKIVERHGGVVWAESTPGEGCSVSFTLPPAQPARQANSETSQEAI